MTQQPDVGPDPRTEYLEQLLRTDRTAWELFRMGYETGLARSIDHEHLSRIIRAMELEHEHNKSFVKSTAGFIDVLAHRQQAGATPTHPRRNAA
ncbi:hypothetical protein [Paeniglutamicibacter cryotolerans]|uniref:Uncharacterized protein n=1 Tax=Paeniglutamicibacter cryotolerans TaxID=670079 RepID=A0A839QJC0_9MICC|nr:hypothetical protein [Paeniglutamicibacter cryotolerans]MBB2995907.1 hypothetical protein [Paeniglutamicibacter cryotolerans]